MKLLYSNDWSSYKAKLKVEKTPRVDSTDPFHLHHTAHPRTHLVIVCYFFHISHISVFGLVSNHSLILGEFDTRSRCAFSNSDWSRAVGKITPKMISIRSNKAKSPTVICKKKKTEWVENSPMSISSLKLTKKKKYIHALFMVFLWNLYMYFVKKQTYINKNLTKIDLYLKLLTVSLYCRINRVYIIEMFIQIS